MRVSQLFGETLREPPGDAELASHRLLLQAGYIRPLAAGIFSYLPLGLRAINKIGRIIREELDAIGGQELRLPVVHPAELWRESGRWDQIGAELARLRDRNGRDLLLAMTHEEVVTDLARREVRSYRQLPQLVYQIQTKFRDEPRARGGLIRMREFSMKDSYSLDRDLAGLQRQYEAHYQAYLRIFARCGLPVLAVGSDTGMMGGLLAHEFMYLNPHGEDTLLICANCGYAANREVARFQLEVAEEAALPLERVATPNTPTIAALAEFLQIPAARTAKVVFLTGEYGAQAPQRLLMILVRGDMEVNEAAVRRLSGALELRPASSEEISAAGAVPGYASPIGVDRSRISVLADELLLRSANLVAGANQPGYHLRNVCYGRDYEADQVGPLAAAYAGAACPQCGTPLDSRRGIEVGNIFQLGTRYSSALNAGFLDERGEVQPIVMGSYGIGLDRLLACIAEAHHDQQGLALPAAVAPYQVALLALGKDQAPHRVADELYRDLRAAGIEVLYDDRDARPGVKFADADLRGIPLRVTVSERSLAQGSVELKPRRSSETRQLALTDVVADLQAGMRAEG